MRKGTWVWVLPITMLACSGRRLLVGQDTASGGHPGSAGAAASTGGASGSGGAASSGGTLGTGGRTGSGGGGGATGPMATGGSAPTSDGLSLRPGSASFDDTPVAATSAPRAFTLSNGGGGTATTTTALSAALQGTDEAEFIITANACGTTLGAGASCEIAVAFAPRTRSGPRTASLAVSGSPNMTTTVSLSGTALPSLSLIAGGLGGPGFADGTGTEARFAGPTAITSDGTGNLFVADADNESVRKIVLATGAVTTLAGRKDGQVADGTGTAAGFADPTGITSDGAGKLYVLDGDAIRKIDVATAAVSTLTDQTGNQVPGKGTAIGTDGKGALFVASAADGTTAARIRRIDVATGTTTTLADRTGASLRFDSVYDLISDGAGSVYAADGSVVDNIGIATGAVTTLAGLPGMFDSVDGTGANARLAGEGGLTRDANGDLYFTEAVGLIRKLSVATGTVTTLAGVAGTLGNRDGIGAAALFSRPKGVASDGAGNLYVADINNCAIRKVVIATGAVTTFAGLGASDYSLDGIGAAARLGTPGGAATDSAGNLYVTDRDANSIRKIVLSTGVVTTLAGSGQIGAADGRGTAASFFNPNAIVGDGAGNLYVTDTENNSIREIGAATGIVTTIAGGPMTTLFGQLAGIAADGTGNLYVADISANVILKVVIATGGVTTFAGSSGRSGASDGVGAAARFDAPNGLAGDGAGNLYVADSNNSTIRKIVIATGTVTTLAGAAGQVGAADGVGAAARFTYPSTVACDGSDVLYVSDGNGTIRKIMLGSATVSTPIGVAGRQGVLLGALPASLNVPYGLAVLSTGELAIVDVLENSVLMAHF